VCIGGRGRGCLRRDPESQDFDIGRVHEHVSCLRPLYHEASRNPYFIGLAPVALGEKWIRSAFIAHSTS
jgi:hypothetical protein